MFDTNLEHQGVKNLYCPYCEENQQLHLYFSKSFQYSLNIKNIPEDMPNNCREKVFITHCSNCGRISQLRKKWFSENDDYNYDGVDNANRLPDETEQDLPPLTKDEYKLINSVEKLLGINAKKLAKEIIKGLKVDQTTLSVIGLRSLIEQLSSVVESSKRQFRNFAENLSETEYKTKSKWGEYKYKIQWLLKNGFISELDQKILIDIVKVGNFATHRIEIPSHEYVQKATKVFFTLVEKLLATKDFSYKT